MYGTYGGGYVQQAAAYCWHVYGNVTRENCSSESLCVSTVSEASENHSTEYMENSRLNSDSTNKPVEDRRSATASDAP